MDCSDDHDDDAIVASFNDINDRSHEERNDNRCVDDEGIIFNCMDTDIHHIDTDIIDVPYPTIRTIDQGGTQEVLLMNLTTATTNDIIDNNNNDSVVQDAIASYPNNDDAVVMTDDHEPSLDITAQILPDADSTTTAIEKIDKINNDKDGQGSVLKINDIVTVAVRTVALMIIYHPLSILHRIIINIMTITIIIYASLSSSSPNSWILLMVRNVCGQE